MTKVNTLNTNYINTLIYLASVMDTLLRKRKVMPRSTSIIIKMIRKSRTFHSNSLFEHINNYQSEIEIKNTLTKLPAFK